MEKNKRFLITGASSGIGNATAKHLLSCGYNVVATARNSEKLISDFGDRKNCIVIPWDFSDIDSIKGYVKTVNEKAGTINGLVHFSGIQKTMPVHMLKPAIVRDIFEINTFTAMLLVAGFSKKGMFDPGSASFVLISSIAAHDGAYGHSVYAASKGALEGFLHSVTPELAEKGIRINALAPGNVNTPMMDSFTSHLPEDQIDEIKSDYPLGWGEPEDIAELVEFLLNEKSRWITGKVHFIDGGFLERKC